MVVIYQTEFSAQTTYIYIKMMAFILFNVSLQIHVHEYLFCSKMLQSVRRMNFYIVY